MRRVLASPPGCNTSRRGLAARLARLGLMLAAACTPSAPAQAPEVSAASEAPAPGGEPAPLAAEGDAASSSGDDALAASGDDDGLDADIAELSASTREGEAAALARPDPPAAKPAQDALRGRDVVYRVTPKGLVIEIDGFHLRPEAKPFKDKSGAYGVELSLRAESFDGRQFWVDAPKAGPLSIAGKVQGKDGKVQRFTDERGSDQNEEVVLSEAPRTFKQRWPGRGQPKLWAGQTLTLEVGLWGVRAESERERPVRRLFSVKLVAGPRAPAVIEPPAMDWGG